MIGDLYLTSASGAPKLRIGLMIDEPVLSSVSAAIVDQIRASFFAEIVLVVRNGAFAVESGPSASFLSRAWKFLKRPALRRLIAYAVYLKLDARRSYDARLDPLKPVDCSDRLTGVEEIVVVPQSKGYVHRFPAEVVEEIKARDLDVLIRFGFNILKGDILSAAKFGVWSFHHGDNDFYRGTPPYFWEMVEGRPRCGAILQVLNEELDNGLVLAKGQYANEGGLSLFRNSVGPYWGSGHFVIWKLKELHEQGFEALKARAIPQAPYRGQRAVYRKPANGEVVRWLGGAVLRKLKERRQRRILHWQMALRRGAETPSIQPGAGTVDLSSFHFITAPKGHFYADPFLFEREGRMYLFLEDYSYAEQRGDLVVMDVTDGVPATADLCLRTGSHLSYPFVFAHEGETYMIPETMAAGEVALYRAEAFPHRWVKEKVLYEGSIVDTTLWVQDGVFYFFATFIVPGTEAMSLHLFTADSLTGAWRHHPANPISNDVRDARGAGHMFRRDGVLYRPAQDCSGTYGRAIRFYRVDVLTPDAYSETLVLDLEPDAVPAYAGMPAEGIHTYNRAGAFEVIDAKFRLPAATI